MFSKYRCPASRSLMYCNYVNDVPVRLHMKAPSAGLTRRLRHILVQREDSVKLFRQDPCQHVLDMS